VQKSHAIKFYSVAHNIGAFFFIMELHVALLAPLILRWLASRVLDELCTPVEDYGLLCGAA